MTRTITSLTNPEIKAMHALFMRKARKETGLFLVEGMRHIAEGLAHGWQLETLAYDSANLRGAEINRARAQAQHCLEVTPAILEKLTRKDNPQPAVGVFRQRMGTLDDVTQDGCWIALEGVRDPGNLGTVIRSADASGAKGVILVGECCDPFSVEAMRASMGALFAVPLVQASREAFMDYIQTWQGTVAGTALDARAVDFREIDYGAAPLIVMGTEQSGLSPVLMDALPHLVKLPMRAGADSLNLAVSTGVMLYAAMYPWKH